MDWYDGSIADAIRLVREKSRTLLVFIRGTDEVSKVVDQLFDEDVSAVCKNCVALRLDASSEATIQFSAVYAVLTVPCVYLIAPNGRALDVKLGTFAKSDLVDWINEKANESPSDIRPTSEPDSKSNQVTITPVQSTSNTVAPADIDGARNLTVEDGCTANSSPRPLEERVKHVQQLLEAKRRMEAEEEKKKSIEAEISRREMGKAMQDFKERQRATEIEEAIAQRRKDEIEARQLRERLRQQIEDDRRAKQERSQLMNATNENGPATSACVLNRPFINTTNAANCAQVRLQIRLVEGGHVVGKFAPGDTLTGDVRGWLYRLSRDEPDGTGELPSVEDQTRKKLLDLCTNGFRFRQLHPAKLFAPEDEARSLVDLGLHPSAVLVLVPSRTTNMFAIQPTNAGLFSSIFDLVQSGLSSFIRYASWVVGGVYNFGSGLITSVIPHRSGTGQNVPSTTISTPITTSHTNSRSKSSSTAQNRAVRRQGNMARLSHLPDDSDDEQARWNGNSTEQL